MTAVHDPVSDGLDSMEAAIVIGRVDGAVQVTSRGQLTPEQLARLRYVLVDIIDGQGNIKVNLELLDTGIVDLDLLNVVVEFEEQLSARGGMFSVRTKTGQWTRPEPGPP